MADSFSTALSLLGNLQFNPILGELVRHNVPDYLGEHQLSAARLAEASGIDALSLTRALRALSALGAFTEVSPEVFSNTAVSSFFREDGGLRNCALCYSLDVYLKSAIALGYSVATGKSATAHVFGVSIWDYFQNNPAEAQIFNRMLAELRGDEHRQIVDAYEWSGFGTVVDVGGGVGALLATVLESQPSARGVLFEQPSVLLQAEKTLSDRGVQQRCQVVGGSFFDSIPVSGNAWILCQVLHDWADKECLTILSGCRKAMRPDDRLLVMEMVTVPCQPNPRIGLIDMTMLMFFGEARQRTADEYNLLFASSGFELIRILPTAGAFSIVEARPV